MPNLEVVLHLLEHHLRHLILQLLELLVSLTRIVHIVDHLAQEGRSVLIQSIRRFLDIWINFFVTEHFK